LPVTLKEIELNVHECCQRSSIFRGVTQRMSAAVYRRFGQHVGPFLKGPAVQDL